MRGVGARSHELETIGHRDKVNISRGRPEEWRKGQNSALKSIRNQGRPLNG